MALVEAQTVLPYPIEDVFALTIDAERALRWHAVLTPVQQLTSGPVGVGTRWKLGYGLGSFDLEIVDYQPPNRVVFKESTISLIRTTPHFTVELETVAGGTRLRYLAHPDVPSFWQPLMAIVAPPWGKRDLARYFRELKTMLAATAATNPKNTHPNGGKS